MDPFWFARADDRDPFDGYDPDPTIRPVCCSCGDDLGPDDLWHELVGGLIVCDQCFWVCPDCDGPVDKATAEFRVVGDKTLPCHPRGCP